MPKYHEKPAGSAVGTKILLIANPSTGSLEKITLDELKAFVNAGAGLPTLATPTGAIATAISSTQINTSCNAVANATGYVCERSANGSSGWAAVYNGASPSFSNTGLTASTQYFYRWKATASGYNDSGYSATANDTTQAGGGTSYLHRSLFTAPDNTSLIFYTPDDGNEWTHVLGSYEILNNKCQVLSISNSESLAVTDVGQNTYTYTSNMTKTNDTANNYHHIVFRHTDVNNNMKVTVLQGDVYCYKTVAGTVTQVGASVAVPSLDDLTQHTYEIVVGATTFDLRVDGNLVFDNYPIDASLNGNSIGFGFFQIAGPATSIHDVIIVTP